MPLRGVDLGTSVVGRIRDLLVLGFARRPDTVCYNRARARARVVLALPQCPGLVTLLHALPMKAKAARAR